MRAPTAKMNMSKMFAKHNRPTVDRPSTYSRAPTHRWFIHYYYYCHTVACRQRAARREWERCSQSCVVHVDITYASKHSINESGRKYDGNSYLKLSRVSMCNTNVGRLEGGRRVNENDRTNPIGHAMRNWWKTLEHEHDNHSRYIYLVWDSPLFYEHQLHTSKVSK